MEKEWVLPWIAWWIFPVCCVDVYQRVTSGSQTWLAGKWTIYRWNPPETSICRGCLRAMFDSRRVYGYHFIPNKQSPFPYLALILTGVKPLNGCCLTHSLSLQMHSNITRSAEVYWFTFFSCPNVLPVRYPSHSSETQQFPTQIILGWVLHCCCRRSNDSTWLWKINSSRTLQ